MEGTKLLVESSVGFKPYPKYRTKKVNLVLLGGRAGVGKTAAAKYLIDTMTKLYSSLPMEHTGFAKPVKEIAYSVFNWDGKKDEKGRRLLQVIGTDAGRDYYENIWVEYFENSILGMFPPYFVFVDDWRFPNEKSYFDNNLLYELTTIRIERPNNPVLLDNGMEHISENSLSSAENENLVYNENDYYNFSVFNSGTLVEFYKKLDNIISYLDTKIIIY